VTRKSQKDLYGGKKKSLLWGYIVDWQKLVILVIGPPAASLSACRKCPHQDNARPERSGE
jgi:hypothetical protein